jgi:nicotinate phosphoribosyltransferase
MKITKDLYQGSLALLTDFYQLTMAYAYWKSGKSEQEAVFNLFFRKHPFQSGFTIAAGLEYVVDFCNNFSFNEDDLSYLGNMKNSDGSPVFVPDFLDYLKEMKFSCDIDAVEEGTVVFPHTPLIRVKGPLIQCQLLETALLNIINFQTLIATKAARVVLAAKGDTVLEFGLRRAQGIDGALAASRASYIGGCSATSNVMAGKLFGIPVSGTHAHSWIMSFDTELEAFKAYADAFPEKCIFLVDTYFFQNCYLAKLRFTGHIFKVIAG